LLPTFKLFFNFSVEGKSNLKGCSSPIIIIANHSRFYDAFLLGVALGPFSGLTPLRFMAVMKFDDMFLNFMKKIGMVQLTYGLFGGVFVVQHGLGLQKNLKRAKAIIKNKGIVAMFPEGRMNYNGKVGMFKRGISALALSTHAPILPIGIQITKNTDKSVVNKLLRSAGLRKTKIVMRIGKTQQLHTGKTYEEHADDLRQKVVKLVG
jgi:1-acyl-sn-glycerol-3-phosphate acyltransferase